MRLARDGSSKVTMIDRTVHPTGNRQLVDLS